MQPIPESLEAIKQLDAYEDDQHLLEDILAIAGKVGGVVPDCLGLTLALVHEGISLTLVASDAQFAVLDAIQYLGGELGGGPCLDAVASEQVLDCTASDLDENGWQLFSQATAAAGVKSTLTLPIITEGRVTGSVNLYAGSDRAFAGHHEMLADILGAWAAAAVTNADLGFTTRAHSQQAPRVLREAAVIDNAVGLLMAADGLEPEAARLRLQGAALRAGVTVLHVAETMLDDNNDFRD
ncbi:ANTAR domain-containing protein [Nocardioides sp. cx-169]|uniref:ANTAR domain-containing protein n=1 Tax=Nocardioides sp. cx-169 TaxID=2899080 RepID=UPI001E64FC35|nr:ANTAR domain-containing protein [Nocardioides sp. cx-169]MCD4535529.1 ANTAR domain-containing protein [Nocardioides sp. cx-169]